MRVLFANSAGSYPNQFPPLGLLYLASVVREDGHQVSFYDLGALNSSRKLLREQLRTFSPEVVAISLYTTQIESAMSTIEMIKSIVPECIIVVGGPHVSALPGDTIATNKFVDFEVVGEGEETIIELIRALKGGDNNFSGIAGICFRSKNEIVKNEPRGYIQDLDKIPFPAHDLMKPFKYSYDKFANGKKVGIIISSRGCPYQCTFCNKAVFGSRYRRRSPANVINEIQAQKDILGIDEVYFVDDLFVTNAKWLDEFLHMYKRAHPGLPWKCLGRVDQVDEKMYWRMRDAGCFLVQFGIESGNNEVLKKIGKRITKEKAIAAITAAKRARLNCATYFIFGHPGDTYKTVSETIQFALELNADVCHFFVLVPFPGTDNYKLLPVELQKAWNRIQYYHKDQYPISLCELSPEELFKLEKQARYEFYGRWAYFVANVLNFKKPIKINAIKCIGSTVFFAIKAYLGFTEKRIMPKIEKKASA